jgi:sugar phosphate isomerase/epimerase
MFQDPVKTSKLSQEKLREYMVEIMKLAKNMGATVLVDSFGSQVQEQKPKPKPEAPKLRRFNWEDA